MDQGILSTAIAIIKTELNLSNRQFGLFASIFYFGKLIGTIIFLIFFNQLNRKYLLVFSLIIISFCLYIMTKFTQLYIICLSRFIFGLFQVYFLNYMPLWCQQFTFQKTRIIMITLIQLSVPFGIVIGSLTSTVLGWKRSIHLVILGDCLISFVLLCFNEKYFSLTVFSSYDQMSNSIKSQTTNRSIFNTNQLITRKSEENSDGNHNSIFAAISFSFKNKAIVFSLLARALLVLPLTVLHIWLNDYESNVLQFDSKQRLISFCLICTLSPILGTIVGGICGSMFGNYKRKCCLFLAFILFGFSYMSSLFIDIFNSVWLFTLILSVCIFFSTSVIPILTGFIISSIPFIFKNSISLITLILSIAFGNLPGPYFYGLVHSYGLNNHNPFLAIKSLSYFLILPLVMLFLSVIIKYCEKDNDQSNDNNSYLKAHMQSTTIKAKKSNLFTTSIAGIYGHHFEIEDENQDEDSKEFINGSSNLSVENNMNSILSKSRHGSNALEVLNASKDDSNKTYSSHYTADIKE